MIARAALGLPPSSAVTATESPTTTIGVLGAPWRGTVSPGGAIEWDRGRIDWWVAADDRWHDPAAGATVRQERLGGTPVVETRVRVPKGDVIQRVYAVADAGGTTVIELENDSPLPVAVAVSSRDLRSVRPPSDMAPQGIDLPSGAAIHPIGHRATIRLALAHDGSGAGPLPDGLPTALQVVRGWTSQLERSSRLVLPDAAAAASLMAIRSDLALEGLDDPDDDPIAFLLGVHELARLGAPVDPWVPEIASVVEQVGRTAARSGLGWDAERALLAAASSFVRAGDRRAAGDVEVMRERLGERTSVALSRPEGVRGAAWLEDRLARPVASGRCLVLPEPLPESWLGVNFECYRLPAGPEHELSFAVRWHGARPALLWELNGPPGLVLAGVRNDQDWWSTEHAGETLLSAP